MREKLVSFVANLNDPLKGLFIKSGAARFRARHTVSLWFMIRSWNMAIDTCEQGNSMYIVALPSCSMSKDDLPANIAVH
jgi:hypothetical protein